MLLADINTRKPRVIVALDYAPPLPPEMTHNWFTTWMRRRGVAFKRLQGSYDGQPETAWLLPAELEPQLWQTWCKRQESILFLSEPSPANGHRYASLHYRDGRTEELGRWRVHGDTEPKSGAWTYDPDAKLYWVTGEAE